MSNLEFKNLSLVKLQLIFFLFVMSGCIVSKTVDENSNSISSTKQPVNENNFFHLSEGDTFPAIDFIDTSGNKVGLDSIFNDSRGVIFVNGSYSCPSFRGSVKEMNQMVTNQVNTYKIYFIYTYEAHPINGSPYGKSQNNSEHAFCAIDIPQQKTMNQRTEYANKAVRDFNMKANILLDNKNNDFFQKVFSGPNGFLIFTSDRKLVRQQEWFNISNKKTKKELKNLDDKK